MRLDLALLADYAIAHEDGRFYMTGAGFTRIVADQVPHVHPQLSFVMRVSFEAEETGAQYQLGVDAIGPTGQQILSAVRWPISWSDQETQVHSVPVIHASFSAQEILFPVEGTYRFVVMLNDLKLGEVPLEVILRQRFGAPS